MAAKANGRKCLPVPLENGNIYQKRLRSWKRKSTPSSVQSSLADNNAESQRKSTIYTYPIRYKRDQSSTLFSDSLTNESAFFSPSVSYPPPLRTADGLNNNHVTTLNGTEKKRKTSSTSSRQSLSSRSSLTEPLSNPDEETDSLELICPRSPTKRSRLSIDQCFLAENASRASARLLDPCTIDINENTEPTSYSPTTPDSMANAVKMVQPIVDIIFNAFEDQLKTTEQQQLLQSIVPYTPRVARIPYVVPYSIYPSTMYPCCASRTSIQPIILHSVHFNIQLTSERKSTMVGHREITDQSSLPNVAARSGDHSLSLSFSDLKQKLISKIVSNNSDSETETDEHQFKRMMQLAVVGMSALCGYWFF